MRNRIFAAALFLGLLFPRHASALPRSGITPERLTCEYMRDPRAVDVSHPRLSWINAAPEGEQGQGQAQSAWQVRVASSQEKLATGEIDLWDSKKASTDQSTLVEYQGKTLSSRQQCRWQVRVWDKDGNPSEWSSPAYWGMGLLSKADWQCTWIGAPWQGDEPVTKKNEKTPAPLLRKEFEITSEVASAHVYVTGLGYFELFLNGNKVSDDVLVPNQTNYDKRKSLDGNPSEDDFQRHRIMYLSYDVKDMLRKGRNVIGAILGNGFYNVTSYLWVMPYGSPRFLGQLHITYTDGTEQVVVSDESWKAAKSAILMNFIYHGEHYDARQEQPGWCVAGFDDRQWEPVAIRKTPQAALKAQTSPSDRVMETYQPVKIEKLGEGHYKVDFGQQIAGWLRLLNVQGEPGRKIEIKYLPANAMNGANTYTLRGGPPESYSARFTWFGFRAVELLNWPGELQAEQLQAEAVYTEVETTGNFECSNTLFNQINDIWKHSDNNNRHGGINLSDCPRERGGYTGDGVVRTVAEIHNFDVPAVLTKWIQDIADAQNSKTGYVPNAAPWQPIFGGGVGWGAAINVMPWEFYVHYADKDILRSTFDAMKKYVEFMHQWADEDGVLLSKITATQSDSHYHNLGDWCAPYALPPDELVHTYILWLCSDITAKTANILNSPADAKHYAALAGQTRHGFHKRFYDAGKGTYGFAGGNVFALKMQLPFEETEKARVVAALRHDILTDASKCAGLTEQSRVAFKGGYVACRNMAAKYGIPSDTVEREHVLARLKKEFSANGGHIDVGFIGTQLFFEVLAENGLNEVAFGAMNKRDIPSFGWWIDQGATTFWERWDGEAAIDLPMFGGSITWFYRKLAGFNADELQPGYRHIIVRPEPVANIAYAKYSTRTPYGYASVYWRKEAASLAMEVKVPVGSTATVYVPLMTKSKTIKGDIVAKNKMKYADYRGTAEGYAIYSVKSGIYKFYAD